MAAAIERSSSGILASLGDLLRKCLFQVLSVGPIPRHVAFIMDGNRRYARKRNVSEIEGYRAGHLAFMSMVKYSSELGLKYVSFYAFSIDNFNRRPHEINMVMDLMQENLRALLKEQSIFHSHGIRVLFFGNLKLLNEPLQTLAKEAMEATANNTKVILCIFVAYTSTNEIMCSVRESCREKMKKHPADADHMIMRVGDLERHMDSSMIPDPDIMVRTSGETRLSNFLLWQTTHCYLYAPTVLWPEISLWHLVWAVLNFQRLHSYLEHLKNKKKKKNMQN